MIPASGDATGCGPYASAMSVGTTVFVAGRMKVLDAKISSPAAVALITTSCDVPAKSAGTGTATRIWLACVTAADSK